MIVSFGGLGDTVRTLAHHHSTLYAGASEIWGYDVEHHTRVSVMQGHTRSVYSLCVLEDGRVCSGSADNTIKIWSGTHCVRTLVGHTDIVRALITNGRYLISGSFDHTLKLWCARTWECVRTFTPPLGNINALACYRDRYLYAAGALGVIAVYDLGRLHSAPYILKGHQGEVTSLSIYGDVVVSGSVDGNVKLWQATYDGKQPHVMDSRTHGDGSGTVACVLGSRDAGRMFSAGADVKVWDMDGFYQISTITTHSAPVRSLTLCANNVLASGSQDKTVQLHAIEGGLE